MKQDRHYVIKQTYEDYVRALQQEHPKLFNKFHDELQQYFDIM